MLFASRGVRTGKCARGLDWVRRPRTVVKTADTVLTNTDRPRPSNNLFSLRYCFESNFWVELYLKPFSSNLVRVLLTFRAQKSDTVCRICLTLCWLLKLYVLPKLEILKRSVLWIRMGKSSPLDRTRLANLACVAAVSFPYSKKKLREFEEYPPLPLLAHLLPISPQFFAHPRRAPPSLARSISPPKGKETAATQPKPIRFKDSGFRNAEKLKKKIALLNIVTFGMLLSELC